MDKNYWFDCKDEISEYINKLWNCPELPMMEYESSKILGNWLEESGFAVKRNYCGMPTSFYASYGSGAPMIAFLAEYDGLAGLANDAVTSRKPLSKRAGHACLHCHIGASNAGAAIAVKKYLEANSLSGTIIVVGCPAEELLWGKVALLGKGAFDGIDTLLTCHVDYQNAAVSRPTLSCFSGEFSFGGVSSHSGAARAHNALDGVELAVASIERMRGHQFPKSSVEHIIRNGGDMPNITPDRASLWVNVRDANYETAKTVYEYIREIVQKSASLAGVSVAEGFLAGTRGYLPNHVLGELLYKNLKNVGAYSFSQQELDIMEELTSNATGNAKVNSFPEIQYLNEGIDPYSQDDGEVSWHIPLGRINWEIPSQIPLHNWCTTALAGMEFSHSGALMASETLYRSAVDMFNEPEIIKAAQNELSERLNGEKIAPPTFDSFEKLTSNPEAFWNGTWLNDHTYEQEGK